MFGMADDLGILNRNGSGLDINVDRREENGDISSEDKLKPNDIPGDVLKHMELYEQSYYRKKYLAKYCKDYDMMFHIALHKMFENKIEKANKYFQLSLKEMQALKKRDRSIACKIFELKILAGIYINEQDLEDLKSLIEIEKLQKAEILFGLVRIHQDGNNYKISISHEDQNSLIEDMKNKLKFNVSITIPSLLKLTGGIMFVKMARKNEENSESYYYFKYSAMCCCNLEAIRVLQKLCPKKKEYYENLYEEAKNLE